MKQISRIIILTAFILPLLLFCSCSRNEGDKLLVMSYNIRNAKANDGENSWENRRPATVELLRVVHPDIFGVQEAYKCQVDYIIENCPDYVTYGVGRDDGKDGGEHASIFYDKNRLEMEDHGTYWLSETPDVPSMGWDAACYRTATWALMRDLKSGREFFFVNTHLDHRGVEAKKNGLALIVSKIAAMNPRNLPMILTGDFNITPDNPCLADLDKIMTSARSSANVSTDQPSSQGFGNPVDQSVIDYVYYSGFSSCSDFDVVDDTFLDIPYISDHYPVTATLVY